MKPAPTAVAIAIEAKAFLFSPDSVQAPAGISLRIEFRNTDAGVPHNVVVRRATGEQVFSGSIITGVSTTAYHVAALAAGTYAIACIVHPEMSGSLVVR